MRRSSLNNLSPAWKKAAILLLTFAGGIGVDRLIIFVSPLVYRTVAITNVHGTKDQGCEGLSGWNSILFGRPIEVGDGVWKAACNEHVFLSDTEALFCDCR